MVKIRISTEVIYKNIFQINLSSLHIEIIYKIMILFSRIIGKIQFVGPKTTVGDFIIVTTKIRNNYGAIQSFKFLILR